MNEAEWLACPDHTPMLDFLRGKAGDRKLRLFAVACCRRIWHLIVQEDERCPKAVEAAEQYTDGQATREELASLTAYPRTGLYAADAAFETAKYVPMTVEGANQIACIVAETEAEWQSGLAYQAAFPEGYEPASGRGEELERITSEAYDKTWPAANHLQALLLRDIFGNPFRPVALDPAWLTWKGGTIPQLAQAIYDGRAFDRLPILADALEEAGCTNADILGHCRQPGEHVRGCWVVDVLLGKE
jgi:hypothetical protein